MEFWHQLPGVSCNASCLCFMPCSFSWVLSELQVSWFSTMHWVTNARWAQTLIPALPIIEFWRTQDVTIFISSWGDVIYGTVNSSPLDASGRSPIISSILLIKSYKGRTMWVYLCLCLDATLTWLHARRGFFSSANYSMSSLSTCLRTKTAERT